MSGASTSSWQPLCSLDATVWTPTPRKSRAAADSSVASARVLRTGVTLHAYSAQLDDALAQRNKVQDITKRLHLAAGTKQAQAQSSGRAARAPVAHAAQSRRTSRTCSNNTWHTQHQHVAHAAPTRGTRHKMHKTYHAKQAVWRWSNITARARTHNAGSSNNGATSTCSGGTQQWHPCGIKLVKAACTRPSHRRQHLPCAQRCRPGRIQQRFCRRLPFPRKRTQYRGKTDLCVRVSGMRWALGTWATQRCCRQPWHWRRASVRVFVKGHALLLQIAECRCCQPGRAMAYLRRCRRHRGRWQDP